MDRRAVLERCRQLSGATEEFPFGQTVAVFKIGGRMFALITIEGEPAQVSLKCDPGFASLLREHYPAVTAGYHLNKRHWNTVTLDGSVPARELLAWVDDSYALVVAGLSRAERARLPQTLP
ncbi:MAG: MmcQ/YjbR family DNA-binding protein [Chloroflexi bacterium]|nr:MmcQ/YjbR family DNA-binding protein [Chloroflexota bacterium]